MAPGWRIIASGSGTPVEKIMAHAGEPSRDALARLRCYAFAAGEPSRDALAPPLLRLRHNPPWTNSPAASLTASSGPEPSSEPRRPVRPGTCHGHHPTSSRLGTRPCLVREGTDQVTWASQILISQEEVSGQR